MKKDITQDPIIKEIIDTILFGKEFNWINNEEFIKTIKEEKSKEDWVISCHFQPGMNIRNHFKLWIEESDQHKAFKNLGYDHPDDMSHDILEVLYDLTIKHLI